MQVLQPHLRPPESGTLRFNRPSSPGAYTVIAPNENRRNQIQRIAEQELQSLEKWKEQHGAKPINLAPRRLGGSQSEAEVRQKQQLQLMQSKYQQKGVGRQRPRKTQEINFTGRGCSLTILCDLSSWKCQPIIMLKREESVRIRKEAEEAKMQKMKAIQREKSNKLEEKKKLQESLRREAFREHRQYKTAEFLSRLEAELPDRSTRQIALRDPQSSTWARSQAYKDSLKEEENKKLQKKKEEQHQKVFTRSY
uniref:epithelial-stromal interaction protein 1 isoform X3 n=1 Tax=Halichoerus grypus TaxID=9711 RepID=UPI0016597B89|nr:epithelial-stromal interaction protein 1 isoform X3 [Halichoerus grypus]